MTSTKSATTTTLQKAGSPTVFSPPYTPATDAPLRASVFLAGPCHRPGDPGADRSWHKEAVELFRQKGFFDDQHQTPNTTTTTTHDGNGNGNVIFIPQPQEDARSSSSSSKTPTPAQSAAGAGAGPAGGGVSRMSSEAFDAQVSWETKHLQMADVILFWIPRSLQGTAERGALPGFTTNIEWGLYVSSGKAVLGCPPEAVKCDFLKWWAKKEDARGVVGGGSGNNNVTPFFYPTLEAAVDHCLEKLTRWGLSLKNQKKESESTRWVPSNDNTSSSLPPPLALSTLSTFFPRPSDPLARIGTGEQSIPLLLWRSRCFTNWYTALRQAGHVLEWANVEWQLTLKHGHSHEQRNNSRNSTFLAVVSCRIRIPEEGDRIKANEVIVFRPDVASVIAWYHPSAAAAAAASAAGGSSNSTPMNKNQNQGAAAATARLGDVLDTEIVLTKEFRAAVRNATGMVAEPPGGSGVDEIAYDFLCDDDADEPIATTAGTIEEGKDKKRSRDVQEDDNKHETVKCDPQSNKSGSVGSRRMQQLCRMAMEELEEEAGLTLDPSSGIKRLQYVGSRQLAATLCAHQAHVFGIALNADEIGAVKKAAADGTTYGVAHESERTTVTVVTLRDILLQQQTAVVDFSTLGQIYQAVLSWWSQEVCVRTA